MLRLWWRFRSERRGSQVVEFALIGPILIYLVLCIPVFAMFARTWIVISGAAREGARSASFYGVGNREGTAKEVAASAVYLEHGEYFEWTRDVEADVSGGMVTVRVTYWQPTFLPGLHRILNPGASERGATVPLTATATFKVEE